MGRAKAAATPKAKSTAVKAKPKAKREPKPRQPRQPKPKGEAKAKAKAASAKPAPKSFAPGKRKIAAADRPPTAAQLVIFREEEAQMRKFWDKRNSVELGEQSVVLFNVVGFSR